MTAFFFPTKNPRLEPDHLWIEITDGKVPAEWMASQPQLFMVEHDAPSRVMIDLSAFITLLVDMRK